MPEPTLLFLLVVVVVGSLVAGGDALDVAPPGAQFYLHTVRTKDAPQLLTANVESIIRSSYFALDPTIISIPRWRGRKDAPENEMVVQAQLARQRCNVFVVDTSDNATDVASAARAIVQLIIVLQQDFAAAAGNMQVIGFSEGAHMAGWVSRLVAAETGTQLQHITALDPSAAGLPAHNLTSADACFVEVIHTNAGGNGLAVPCGHVDYFPNGGSQQPNCAADACAHERAYELAREMWSNNNEFISALCLSSSVMTAETCHWSQVKMGQNTQQFGVFYLETNGAQPFGKGSFFISFL